MNVDLTAPRHDSKEKGTHAGRTLTAPSVHADANSDSSGCAAQATTRGPPASARQRSAATACREGELHKKACSQ